MVRRTAKVRQRDSAHYVFDSFAWLAWFSDEPGAATVQTLLEKAKKNEAVIYVSWVNVAEVYYITVRRSLDADRQLAANRALEVIESLPVQIQPVLKTEALAAARFKAEHPMSLADAFAAALANARRAQIVTGDVEFKPLENKQIVRILWLPRKSAV